jgi:hypothetical protein
MTLEELEYLVAEAYKKREGYIDHDNIDGITLVEAGDWIEDRKYSHCTDTYSTEDGNHFQIHNSRSGSYRTGYYYSAPDVCQVRPVVKTITKVAWEAV